MSVHFGAKEKTVGGEESSDSDIEKAIIQPTVGIVARRRALFDRPRDIEGHRQGQRQGRSRSVTFSLPEQSPMNLSSQEHQSGQSAQRSMQATPPSGVAMRLFRAGNTSATASESVAITPAAHEPSTASSVVSADASSLLMSGTEQAVPICSSAHASASPSITVHQSANISGGQSGESTAAASIITSPSPAGGMPIATSTPQASGDDVSEKFASELKLDIQEVKEVEQDKPEAADDQTTKKGVEDDAKKEDEGHSKRKDRELYRHPNAPERRKREVSEVHYRHPNAPERRSSTGLVKQKSEEWERHFGTDRRSRESLKKGSSKDKKYSSRTSFDRLFDESEKKRTARREAFKSNYRDSRRDVFDMHASDSQVDQFGSEPSISRYSAPSRISLQKNAHQTVPSHIFLPRLDNMLTYHPPMQITVQQLIEVHEIVFLGMTFGSSTQSIMTLGSESTYSGGNASARSARSFQLMGGAGRGRAKSFGDKFRGRQGPR